MSEENEIKVVQQTTSLRNLSFRKPITGADIVAFQKLVRRVPCADPVARYAVALARTSRPGPNAPEWVKKWVSYGASVRAGQHLILGGKARALMKGRYHVSFEDIRALAKPVLRHRVLRNFHAESERITPDQLIDKLLESVPLPKSGM
jgi:MoxR-like ATPase